MPDIPLIRRLNVLTLFQAYAENAVAGGASPKGLEQAFAAGLQISPSMWSQIKTTRPIGDKLARQIETSCNRPEGWLDAEHAPSGPTPTEAEFLRLALTAYRSGDAKERKELKETLQAVAGGKPKRGPPMPG